MCLVNVLVMVVLGQRSLAVTWRWRDMSRGGGGTGAFLFQTRSRSFTLTVSYLAEALQLSRLKVVTLKEQNKSSLVLRTHLPSCSASCVCVCFWLLSPSA